MSDTKQGGFIQFPLCVLSDHTLSFSEALDRGFGWGVMNYIRSIKKKSAGNGGEEADPLGQARKQIGFKGGGLSEFERHESALGDYRVMRENLGCGKSCLVRIPTTYFFEMRNKLWPENEARVYLAIVSKIGVKAYSRIGWKTIAFRAAGYTSRPKRQPKVVLSRDQVNYAAKSLTARNLVSCYTLNRGARYWSLKHTKEQIARFVIGKKLARENQKGETDAQLTERIRKELAALSSR